MNRLRSAKKGLQTVCAAATLLMGATLISPISSYMGSDAYATNTTGNCFTNARRESLTRSNGFVEVAYTARYICSSSGRSKMAWSTGGYTVCGAWRTGTTYRFRTKTRSQVPVLRTRFIRC